MSFSRCLKLWRRKRFRSATHLARLPTAKPTKLSAALLANTALANSSTVLTTKSLMTTLDERIEAAIKSTPAGTRKRGKALASVKWRLRYGLLCAGLDCSVPANPQCVLVSPDDPRVQTFDGRDNENMKLAYYGAALGCKFEIELCAS